MARFSSEVATLLTKMPMRAGRHLVRIVLKIWKSVKTGPNRLIFSQDSFEVHPTSRDFLSGEARLRYTATRQSLMPTTAPRNLNVASSHAAGLMQLEGQHVNTLAAGMWRKNVTELVR